MLQDAKDAFREAATSSLDGALNIYPVQMSPIDWFQSLSTSFTMEDLTSDLEIIFQQINAKSRLLNTLQARLATLQFPPKNDFKALQSVVEQARSAYGKVRSHLQKMHTSNIISLAQRFLSAADFSSTVHSLHKPPNSISLRVRSRASKRPQTQLLLLTRSTTMPLARNQQLCNLIVYPPLACDFSTLMLVIRSIKHNTGTNTAIPRFARVSLGVCGCLDLALHPSAVSTILYGSELQRFHVDF